MNVENVKCWVEHLDDREGSRNIARRLLAEYMGCDADLLRIREDASGRPLLECGTLDFSMSHCDEALVIAAAQGGRIGVDAEFLDRPRQFIEIARSQFTLDEQETIASANSPAETFYACWTAKEAFIKAAGLGLAFGLDQIETGSLPNGKMEIQAVCGIKSLAKGWIVSHHRALMKGRMLLVATVLG